MVEMPGILKDQTGILKHQMSVVKKMDIHNDQDSDLKPEAILINLLDIFLHQQFSWTRILNYFYFKYEHGKENYQHVTDQIEMCYFLLLDII